MISIGMLGCGAVVHANYAKTLINRGDYRVQWVCDTDQAQAESAANLFGAQVVDLEGLTANAEAIIISTPPSSHLSLTRACLAEGRTILCEKPFLTSAADARALVREAKETRTNLFVGHFRRAFPQVELARELVEAGTIGSITRLAASEGGRFTWRAVSNYPVKDPNGGVAWDTGSHTLDMALFAAGLDELDDPQPREIVVRRNKPEPSHDFLAEFTFGPTDSPVTAKLHVSREQSLPNLVTISGTRGEITFVTGLDDRLRLSTATNSLVLHAGVQRTNLIECVDLQNRRILSGEGCEPFRAARFVGQVALLEAISHG